MANNKLFITTENRSGLFLIGGQYNPERPYQYMVYLNQRYIPAGTLAIYRGHSITLNSYVYEFPTLNAWGRFNYIDLPWLKAVIIDYNALWQRVLNENI